MSDSQWSLAVERWCMDVPWLPGMAGKGGPGVPPVSIHSWVVCSCYWVLCSKVAETDIGAGRFTMHQGCIHVHDLLPILCGD
jgi:hypothetical protein